MNKTGWVVWLVLAIGGAVGMRAWAEEPSPLTTLAGATLNVLTNGEGHIADITLTSSGGTVYYLKPAGLPQNILQYNGRSVQVKGEVWPGPSQTWFKVVGPIVAKPTAFAQSTLVTMKTGEEGESHMFLSTTNMKMYDVLTNDLPKDYEKWMGKSVDIVADLVTVDGKQWVKIISFVPPKKVLKDTKKPASSSKKTK